MAEPWDTYMKRQLPSPGKGTLGGRPQGMFGALFAGLPRPGGAPAPMMQAPNLPNTGAEGESGLALNEDTMRRLLSSGALRAGLTGSAGMPAAPEPVAPVPGQPSQGLSGLLARFFQNLG